MIVSKVNRAGIDTVVNYFQEKLYANLLGFWVTDSVYTCYPRANKNYKNDSRIPEISLDEKEYKSTLFDDKVDVNSFFLTPDQSTWIDNNGQLSHSLSIIFQADLIKLYGLSERADEMFKVDVLKVLKSELKYKSGDIQISEGIDSVYSDLTFTNDFKNKIRYSDISNRYVVKFTFDVNYNISCLRPVVPVCLPVGIIKDGVLVEQVPSGQDYEYSSVCADATVTVNDEAFGTVASGGTLPITVEYETSVVNPIASISGSTILITDPVVIPTDKIYLRPIPTGEVYIPADPLFPVGCDSWLTSTGADPFTQPANGVPMLLDKSNPTQLIPDNIFNSKHRFTCHITGGYVDFSTGTYHLVDGTTVTQSEAFPFGLFLDHHTGLRWTNGQIGTTNYTWYDALTLVEGHSQGGYDNYHVPTQKMMDSIFNTNYGATFGSSGDRNPLFTVDITNGNKWTSSTIKGLETRAWAYGVNGASSSGNLKTGIGRVMGFAYHF